jgi:hypothetical protein
VFENSTESIWPKEVENYVVLDEIVEYSGS